MNRKITVCLLLFCLCPSAFAMTVDGETSQTAEITVIMDALKKPELRRVPACAEPGCLTKTRLDFRQLTGYDNFMLYAYLEADLPKDAESVYVSVMVLKLSWKNGVLQIFLQHALSGVLRRGNNPPVLLGEEKRAELQ